MSELSNAEREFLNDGSLEKFVKDSIIERLGKRVSSSERSVQEQVDDVLMTNWICAKNNDYVRALHDLVSFNIQIELDPAVNGGSVVLDPDEVSIVNKLLAGYVVGPEGQKVLDKLRQTS
jgi:hypothetical protein